MNMMVEMKEKIKNLNSKKSKKSLFFLLTMLFRKILFGIPTFYATEKKYFNEHGLYFFNT